MRGLIVVVLLLLSCGVAAAQINVNVTGWWRDGGAFNASGTPIQAAVDAAGSGDTVYVWNGTYNEAVQINVSMSLVGEGRDVVNLISPSDTNFVIKMNIGNSDVSGFNISSDRVSGGRPNGVEIISVDNCNISYNKFSKSATYQRQADIHSENSANNIFNNNIGGHALYGMYLYNSTYNIINLNELYGVLDKEICIYADSTHNSLTGNINTDIEISNSDYNTITSSAGGKVRIGADVNHLVINHSTFTTAFELQYLKSSLVYNNTFNGIIIGIGLKNNTFIENTFNWVTPAAIMSYDASFENNTFIDSVFKEVPSSNYYIWIMTAVTDIIFIDTTFEYTENVINCKEGVSFIQTDNRVFIGMKGHTIANTTATNLTAYGDYDYRPFWITPSTGELNITSTPLWNTTDDYKKQFNITGTTGTFTYTIGDMLPDCDATISTDTWSDTKTANAAGEITGTYDGGWSAQNFTVLSDVPTYYITLAAGWNIFGWSNATNQTAHYVGNVIGSNCTYITERNKTTSNYVTHFMSGPEDENNFAIERGWGYYVRASAETIWARY